ncbi:MAG: L-rhamnose isomerase [Clostridiales Family XIII bacterium]|jgi:L-rhamnose isomerase|nr:L-rhamnose isomerase [Clostridiales Family XIII bacterium]
MTDNLKTYELAKERYAEYGVDTDAAINRLRDIEISLHCWQGDDVLGFESPDATLSGGIMATGNYPGKARNAEELRADMTKAFSLLPGKQRANLHAIYLEPGDVMVGRDAIEAKHFEGWIQWAGEQNVKLDFNTSMFSHPLADGYTLASYDKGIREFWIEHGRRCRRIGAEMGARQKSPCIINHWMIDGCKEPPVDRMRRRELFAEGMDGIIAEKLPPEQLRDSIESKLFGIGMESFTAGSAEFCFGYAMSRGAMLTYDMGHFHPTESIADKVSSSLLFIDKLLLHTSRGVRWDSDHVVVRSDDVDLLMQEVVRAKALDRVYIALDFFDASINRIAAWVIGTRATQKSLLFALLEPTDKMLAAEVAGDATLRLALTDELKSLPFGAVWNHYCDTENVPAGMDWLSEVRRYEKEVLSGRK